jgi:hypothetical protein
MFEQYATAIEKKEREYIAYVDSQLEKAQLECFKYWAERFPKRRLSIVWGMGTHSFDAGEVDLFRLLDYNREKWIFWRPKHDELLAPFLDFVELIERVGGGLYQYPCISDCLYNPITRTIEMGERIIYLK